MKCLWCLVFALEAVMMLLVSDGCVFSAAHWLWHIHFPRHSSPVSTTKVWVVFQDHLEVKLNFSNIPNVTKWKKNWYKEILSYVWERSNKNLELCKFLVFSYGWIPVTFKRIYYPRDKDPRSVLWDNLATLHTFSWLTPVFWRVD